MKKWMILSLFSLVLMLGSSCFLLNASIIGDYWLSSMTINGSTTTYNSLAESELEVVITLDEFIRISYTNSAVFGVSTNSYVISGSQITLSNYNTGSLTTSDYTFNGTLLVMDETVNDYHWEYTSF